MIIVAPTAFKGSLTPMQAARAIARGLRRPYRLVPVADGGDGTLEVLKHLIGGRLERRRVTGPLERPVTANLLWSGRDAYIEMAQVCGLGLVSPKQRDPMRTTTRGLGELILGAKRARRIFVGVGGSATNDGGIGMLQALGAAILDRDGEPVAPGGFGLESVASVDWSRLQRMKLIALTDVTHPLSGAARTFGPQKGATPEMVRRLERAMTRFARLVGLRNEPGAGAAGGVGAALMSVLGARRISGIEFVLRMARFRGLKADAVITGEGHVDRTTLQGKALSLVIRQSQAPVYVICGGTDLTPLQLGVAHIEVLPAKPLAQAARWVERAARCIQARLDIDR